MRVAHLFSGNDENKSLVLVACLFDELNLLSEVLFHLHSSSGIIYLWNQLNLAIFCGISITSKIEFKVAHYSVYII